MKSLRLLLLLLTAVLLVVDVVLRLKQPEEELRSWQTESAPFDPALLRLSAVEVAALPVVEHWTMPLGSETGALTYNARPFRIERHLGDDLNGIGGYHSDLGDTVWAAADGQVIYAGNAGPGWGKVVVTAARCAVEVGGPLEVVQVLYAHLQDVSVLPAGRVLRGEKLGTVGTGEGKYLAHLHVELRKGPLFNPGVGYAEAALNRMNPTAFIAQRQHPP